MSSPYPKRLVSVALVLSLLLNGAMLGYLAKSGGLRRIFVRMDLAEHSEPREGFQKGLEARYRKLPNNDTETIFAGDSLIGSGHWAEFYSDIHNRGIGGETTSGMLGRLDEITESKPKKLFLLLGTNDLAKAVPVAQLLRNYRTILERIRKDSPDTVLRVIGILPVNPEVAGTLTQSNDEINEANAGLKKLVGEFPGAEFIDLSPCVVDASGKPRNEFYLDKVHLNDDGYLAIRETLAPYVKGGDRPGAAPPGKPDREG